MSISPQDGAPAFTCFEDVEVRGHIIDSLILPKILDCIVAGGGGFRIKDISVGQARDDPSFALLEVQAPTEQRLREILDVIYDHGAAPVVQQDCRLVVCDVEGAFPEGFYSTTNQRTEVRLGGDWMQVEQQEMDCGIVVDEQKPVVACGPRGQAVCTPMCEVKTGQKVVVGHAGVRVYPQQREEQAQSFEFMNSAVSTEKPKGVAIRQVAQELFKNRGAGGKTVVVGGPAIIHSGSGEHFCRLIRDGYVDVLLAGNALAAHDIEHAMFGTSLGVKLDCGDIVEAGHEHHLRAINRVRRRGGIAAAVEAGELTSGVMYECVKRPTEFFLAGSIRDDGPLPDVETDVLRAQSQMRQLIQGASFCLMVATTLHSIAVGNLLPAWVKVVCVDINPSTVIKLSDRGSFQTIGLVTDVEPFMRALVTELHLLEQKA